MKEKHFTILFSLLIVFSVAAVMYFQPPFFKKWIIKLENTTYDTEVRHHRKPLPSHPSIVIVDIDDKSISSEGRWPWDRMKVAKLATELHRLGASVIAFDAVFSEPQENPVDTVLQEVHDPALTQELEHIRPTFDADAALASALQQGTFCLGFAFASNGKESGLLPPPLLTLEGKDVEEFLIVPMNGYIGNQPILQEAAKYGGFINTTIDSDGILRFSPLLQRVGGRIYPSLALEATKQFLSLPFSGILTTRSGKHRVISSIQLGDINIPTDPWARMLIPFRGPPYTFPYLSAVDVLEGAVSEDAVRGKLVFVGTSATASWDLLATAISPVFPGVEVQASIASGIIDGYLPYKPNWGRGVAIAMLLLIGTLATFLFPRLGHIGGFCFFIAVIVVLKAFNYWLWTRYAFVLSFFLPMPTLGTLFALDLISVYLSKKWKKRKS